MRLKNKLMFAVIACFLAGAFGMSQALAGTMGREEIEEIKPVQTSTVTWVATVSGGAVWARAGKTQTFFLTPELEKTYVAKKSSNALASGEFFLGFQKTLSTQLKGRLGLALAATGDARLRGVIWNDADPAFKTLSYNYKVRHRRAALKGKLIADNGDWLAIWISGSIGVGYNKAHSFSNMPLIFEAIPNNNFKNNTKTSFAYTLGAGVQKNLNEHWQIGIGYEFADWGKSQLGRASGQTLNKGLVLKKLHANDGVMLNLSFIM